MHKFELSLGKPWKFGILYRSLNDSEVPYTYRIFPCAGKPEGEPTDDYVRHGSRNEMNIWVLYVSFHRKLNNHFCRLFFIVVNPKVLNLFLFQSHSEPAKNQKFVLIVSLLSIQFSCFVFIRGAAQACVKTLQDYVDEGNEVKGRNITVDRGYGQLELVEELTNRFKLTVISTICANRKAVLRNRNRGDPNFLEPDRNFSEVGTGTGTSQKSDPELYRVRYRYHLLQFRNTAGREFLSTSATQPEDRRGIIRKENAIFNFLRDMNFLETFEFF